MKASIAVQILPNMSSDVETIRVVDEVIAYIASTGLHYFVGPSETSIEGEDLHELIGILENCMKIASQAGSKKVSAYVKLNYRAEGTVLGIDEKIEKHHR